MPTRIALAQKSDAWLDWRRTGIGGSDASTIMFENPYQSPYVLWSEKVGKRPPKKLNKAMQRGIALEDTARLEFCKKIGEFLPQVCLQHETRPFMLASLDGLSPDGKLAFEVKVPTAPHTHLSAREGQVPRQYYAQCQHNLFVSGAAELYFVSYYPRDKQMPLAEVLVTPDEGYLAQLLDAEAEFWSWVEKRQFPFPEGERDLSADARWDELAASLWEADQMKQVALDRYEAIRAEMARIAMRQGVRKVTGAGVVATWIHMRERVQTMPETVFLRVGHTAEDGE